MNDLQSKLSTLEAQLAAAKAELEAAKTKASQTDVLSEKLSYLTRARAAQDLISSLEGEISAVQHAIAEEQRLEHRAELLERGRGISHEIQQQRDELQSLIQDVAEAVARLQREAPRIIARWRSAREKWLAVFSALEGQWPGSTGDIENSRRLQALERVLNELGEDGRALLQLPPPLRPGNRLESTTFEPRNWSYSPPSSPEDFSLLVLDSILSRPYAQPATVAAPDPSKSL